MLIAGSRLLVSDNSGAKEVECIKTKGKVASIGDIITCSVKKASKGKVSMVSMDVASGWKGWSLLPRLGRPGRRPPQGPRRVPRWPSRGSQRARQRSCSARTRAGPCPWRTWWSSLRMPRMERLYQPFKDVTLASPWAQSSWILTLPTSTFKNGLNLARKVCPMFPVFPKTFPSPHHLASPSIRLKSN